MTESEARAHLASMVASSEEPTLTQAEIDDLIRLSRLYALPIQAGVVQTTGGYVAPDEYRYFRPSTEYAADARLVPTVRNGHVYKVTVAGTSGGSEPAWPTAAGATVVSGGVTFQEAGAAPWSGAWDLDRAAAEGWRRKAAKAAGNYKFTAAGGGETDREQIFRRCLEMAKHYSRGVRSMSVSGATGPPTNPLAGVVINRG